ncbi:MAG TPA: sulfite exporter TauE/SafE family protein [Candidatus Aquilonibacter sp.]|nr:sulfite exporter TauE/SafE family protein [Candidatus Aquilonibacter sp.]
MSITQVLWILLWVVGVAYGIFWVLRMRASLGFGWPSWLGVGVGFLTDFLDTLGIGSFAPTTSLFKFFKLVPDEQIPGTLNVGHTLPTVVEALAFIAIVAVDPLTLVSLIVAAVLGAYLGAGLVARWPRRYVQIGMGAALLVAAVLFVMKNLSVSTGGTALGLTGSTLVLGIVINFCLGALMTIGVGLYAPAMIMIGLLGMDPKAAFPIMMGSCAFLMPAASVRFVRLTAYDLKAALGLTIGGIPGVLVAAFIVKSLPMVAVRWLVIVVVLYAAFTMLRSAMVERRKETTAQASA